jgi:hypothetical protein
MIYEMRVHAIRPGTGPIYEALFAEMYRARKRYSPLCGMWHSDIGALDEVIELWTYDDLQHRFDVQAAAGNDPHCAWPPQSSDFVVSRKVEILEPIANSPDLAVPRELGAIYELRLTTYEVDVIDKVAAGFSASLAGRAAIYPMVGIFTATLGHLHHLYQIYPFKNWNHRAEVRSEFYKTGVWPPPHDSVPHPLTEVVRYMIPAQISPLH